MSVQHQMMDVSIIVGTLLVAINVRVKVDTHLEQITTVVKVVAEQLNQFLCQLSLLYIV